MNSLSDTDEVIHTVEVALNSRVLTKNDISLAFECAPGSVLDSVGNALFQKFCKALGFE